MRKNTALAGLICLLVFQARGAFAAEKESLKELLQEFSIAETVFPQEKGELQVTLGPEYWKGKDLNETRLPLSLEYGITDRFQVGLEAPYHSVDPAPGSKKSGIGDIEAGVLFCVLEKDRPVAVSLALDVGLPAGSEKRGLGEGETALEPSVLLAGRIGKGQVHLGLGGEFGANEPGFIYNLAGVYPLGDLSPTLEINGESADETLLYFTPGLILRELYDDLELGFGIPIGMTAQAAHWGVIVKATYEFSLKK